MGIFKKRPKFDVRVFQAGDIVLINGGAYLVTPSSLQQIPVKTVEEE